MRYDAVPRVQQAAPRYDDSVVEPEYVRTTPAEGPPSGANPHTPQSHVGELDPEQVPDNRERLADRGDRQQHRGRATAWLAPPAAVRVSGDVHAHARPSCRPPEQRLAYLDGLEPVDRHRLRVPVEQSVPQPNPVARKREGEAVVTLQPLPRQADRCDRLGDRATERVNRSDSDDRDVGAAARAANHTAGDSAHEARNRPCGTTASSTSSDSSPYGT